MADTATQSPKTVQPFAFRRVSTGGTIAAVTPEQKPVTIKPAASRPIVPQAKPLMVEKLKPGSTKTSADATGLRTDGPTLEEFEAAGGDPTEYPPPGYAVRKKLYRFAKLSGTTARTVFADGSFYQWTPRRRHGGGYQPTTSCETTDADLAAKLREAAKTDKSIREAPAV